MIRVDEGFCICNRLLIFILTLLSICVLIIEYVSGIYAYTSQKHIFNLSPMIGYHLGLIKDYCYLPVHLHNDKHRGVTSSAFTQR